MNASVADDMLRNYFERWQRLEEEKRTVSDDLKELFSEAKGHGFDTKAMRAVFREQVGDKAAAQEFDAICDLYRASLNGPRAGRAREGQSYAEVKGKSVAGIPTSETEPHDPETGELTDTQEQPETATQSADMAVGLAGPALAGSRPAANTKPAPKSAYSGAQGPSVGTDSQPPAGSGPEKIPATHFDNPRCERPSTCPNAHSKDTCWECTMAWAKRPKEEQVMLWQQAVEASRTQAA